MFEDRVPRKKMTIEEAEKHRCLYSSVCGCNRIYEKKAISEKVCLLCQLTNLAIAIEDASGFRMTLALSILEQIFKEYERI